MSKMFVLFAFISLFAAAQAQDLQKAMDLDLRGLDRFAKGQYDAAIADFTRSIELSSRLTPSASDVGNRFRGETAEEAALRDKVSVVDPNTAGTLVNRGNALFAKADVARAIDDYDRAIRIAPAFAPAYACRGLAYILTGDYDKAMADLERAIKIDDKLVSARLGRGLIRMERHQMKEALADFETAIRLEPKNAQAYYRRGSARFAVNDSAGAEADFELAIKYDDKFSDFYVARGDIYFNRGDYDLAINEYTKAISLQNGNGRAFRDRGLALYAKGLSAEAMLDFESAYARDDKLRTETESLLKKVDAVKANK